MAGLTYRRGHAWSTACLLLSLLLIHPLTCFAENTILIIKSNDNKFFNTTIEQLVDRTEVEAKYTIRTLKSFKQNSTSDLNAQLIITLGHEASEYAHGLDIKNPVIHSYVTEFQYKEHPSKHNHSSVLLEQPLERYVLFIKYLLAVKNIGILKTSEEQVPASELRRIQQKYKLNMNQSIFHKGDNPVSAVRHLLDNNDVLLTLPAPEIYNRKSLKGILLTSYRMNRPVISYSPSHVKSGALAAIYTTPENIGQQLAELVTQFLKQDSVELKPVYFASDFNISINQRVAESLHLHLADRESILKLLRQESNR
jgi:ABC-type uncharacterized transport system substrate-binding protein